MSYNQLTKGRYSAAGQDYFVTFTTLHRKPVLAQFSIASIVARVIHNLEVAHCIAWVIMPDHVHLLLTLNEGQIADSIRKIKGRSSHEINQLPISFRWAPGYYEHALRQEEARENIARYIVANPLRAKLVKKLGDYPWWNAAYL